MARDEIEAQVIAIIAEQALLEPGDVTADQTLDQLGIDSLGVVEAIFAIEETFEVSVPFNANAPANDPDESGFDLSSVGAIVAAVRALVAAEKA